jgi:hypothetical protein
LGEGEYRKSVAALYASKPGAWMTPVEVFRPHYSFAIAKWICTVRGTGHMKANSTKQRTLHVVEVGGGTGSNAALLMEWFSTMRPDEYKTMRL